MSHHTSQSQFLFAALPACTATSVVNSQPSFGGLSSSSSSISSGISSIRTLHNGDHSFYNLSMDSNRSNVDLTQSTKSLPHHPYPSVYNHSNHSNFSINQHTTRGHNIYGFPSNASSCLSVASQFSIDKVNHAFGSLPAPCPIPSFSASSSSLPLASSVNSPITTPSVAKTKSSSTPSSITSRHRTPSCFVASYPSTSQKRPLSRSSSGSDIAQSTYTTSETPSSSLRTFHLEPVATLGQLAPRKRIPNSIPPLDTRTLPPPVPLSPSFLSSHSATMSSVSPNSAYALSLAGGNIYSENSSTSGSIPSTPTYSRPLASMAITELVMSEAHHLTALNRIALALAQSAEGSLTVHRKESATIRSLVERWAEMTRAHAKFHDDVVAVNEDLRETALLIHGLLETLEPMLLEHSRDLSISLKKLTRRDQNPEHTLAEWDSALRQPFEHLTSYDEWIQRIDPHSMFCKDYRAHLNGVIYKVKAAADTNPQSRNVLRRIGTMARGVMKRRSSIQTASQTSSPISESLPSPLTPLSANTVETDATIPSPNVDKPEYTLQSAESIYSVSVPLPEIIQDLTIADNDMAMNAVMKPASSSSPDNDPSHQHQHYHQLHHYHHHHHEQESEKELPAVPTSAEEDSEMKEPSTPIADTFLAPVHATRQLQHRSSTSSELSSAGTLAIDSMEATPSLLSSSASSMYSRSSSCAETLQGRPIRPSSSLARQSFLAEKDARKATLRVGTCDSIQARAESLQSPTSPFKSKPSIDGLRKISPMKTVKDSNKPPVKSLINFWEQVSDPLDS